MRLAKGDFDEATFYDVAPAQALRRFADAGAGWAHIVDLDGARAGTPRQHALIAALAEQAPLQLQVAGGFRTAEHIAAMLDAGVGRIVIGSLAVRDPHAVAGFFDLFGSERITLALDVKITREGPEVVTAGWTEGSGQNLWDVAALYPQARHMLITDVGRDGMMGGPNAALLEEAVARLPHVAIQASGGVSGLADLLGLPTASVIIGRAYWEGHLDLAEAVRACR